MTQTSRKRLLALSLMVIAVGVALRCAYLGERPMHHDEAIHATFSFYWFENPSTGYYKYDPTYHGALLYWVVQWLYTFFGVGQTQARLFPLLFGCGVLASPWFFRRWMGTTSALIATVMLAISPLMVYYSRFLAHDMPTAVFTLLSAGFFIRFLEHRDNPKRAPLWLCAAASSLGLLFCVKASSFIHTFIFATFGILYALVLRKKAWIREWKNPDTWALWFLAVSVFLVTFATIETAIFRNPVAFADGLFRKVIPYWWGQHSVERLGGPATYHLRSLLLHELPVTLLLFAVMGRETLRFRWGKYALGLLIVIVVVTIPFPWNFDNTFPFARGLWKATKVHYSPDLFLYASCFIFGVAVCAEYLKRGKIFLAFLTYWNFATLAIYSFAGEKTPWLSVHPALPTIFLVAYLLPRWAEELSTKTVRRWAPAAFAVCAVMIAYQIRLAHRVNFVTESTPGDLLSQIHNTKDVLRVVDWMNRAAIENHELPRETRVGLIGEPTWGFYFYFIKYGFRNYVGTYENLKGDERFVIIGEDQLLKREAEMVAKNYQVTKLHSRGWWVPEHHKVSWGDWIAYAWTRQPRKEQIALTPMYVFYKPKEGSPASRQISGERN